MDCNNSVLNSLNSHASPLTRCRMMPYTLSMPGTVQISMSSLSPDSSLVTRTQNLDKKKREYRERKKKKKKKEKKKKKMSAGAAMGKQDGAQTHPLTRYLVAGSKSSAATIF